MLGSSCRNDPAAELRGLAKVGLPAAALPDPPANAKVEEVALPRGDGAKPGQANQGSERPHVTSVGHGLTTVAVLESKSTAGAKSAEETLPEGLQKVKIDGIEAAELPTELGTLLGFERSGVRYLLAGAVSPAAVEAVAKGL